VAERKSSRYRRDRRRSQPWCLGANAFVAYYNGYTTRAQEQIRADNALEVEKEKSKTSLILQEISTNDASKAHNNIQFFVASGILSDNDHKILDAAATYAPSLPAPAPTTSGEISKEKVTQLLSSGFVLGVSVSHFNAAIDFALLKDRGVRFAYIKLTSGAFIVDPAGLNTAKLALSSGIKVGLYHFFRPADDIDAQARNFVKNAAPISWELPPVIDCEDFPAEQIPSDYAARVDHFAAILEEQFRVRPIIYTPRSFATAHFDEREAKYPLFIAQFTASVAPSVPKPWSDFTFWHVGPGVSDDSVLHGYDIIAFKGSVADLDALDVRRK
jgi:lysozyme